jgi:molecular chaperone GrpE (heat shock protein)
MLEEKEKEKEKEKETTDSQKIQRLEDNIKTLNDKIEHININMNSILEILQKK